ncbi:MAG: aldo/keto reductase, partial [Planctomycetota bacterium]
DGGRCLAEVAKRHGATPRQVALAFLLREGDVFAIPCTFDGRHALDNAAAGDLELADEDIAALDAAFPRGPEPSSLPVI